MMRLGTALATGLVALCGLADAAHAADMAYRERARVYERPVPRVYYQAARPTAVCRVAFMNDRKTGWPREQSRTARCTQFD